MREKEDFEAYALSLNLIKSGQVGFNVVDYIMYQLPEICRKQAEDAYKEALEDNIYGKRNLRLN